MKFGNKNQSGFTLIELLVVIAIIGLLASVVLSSVNVVRTRARDAKRLADISQLQKALELYYLNNNAYPLSGPSGNGLAWSVSTDSATWNDLQTRMASVLAKLPLDPSQAAGTSGATIYNGANYGYTYFSGNFQSCIGGEFYIIVFKQERLTITSPGGMWCDGITPINYNTASGAGNNITHVGKAR